MSSDHPSVKPPDKEDQKIWRYIKFPVFASMLSTGTICFARADSFDDRLEGSYPQKEVTITKEMLESNPAFTSKEFLSALKSGAHRMREWLMKHHFVNCWHMNDIEHEGMWRLYGDVSTSVCLQSTYARFRDETGSDVHIGTVDYTDYEFETFDVASGFDLLLHKHQCFRHEQELRAIIFDHQDEGMETTPCTVSINGEVPKKVMLLEAKHKNGIACKLDLNKFLQTVVLPPHCPRWFEDVVRSLAEKYELSSPIVKSTLDLKASTTPNYVLAQELLDDESNASARTLASIRVELT